MSESRRWPVGFLAVSAACAACGVAAVRQSSDRLASVATSLLVVVLILAVLHARFGDERSRRFYWGFAAAGWAYLIVSYGPLGAQIRKDLVTCLIIDQVMPAAPADPQAANVWNQVDRPRWQLVGHALFTLGAGLAGGLFAARIGRSTAAVVDGPDRVVHTEMHP